MFGNEKTTSRTYTSEQQLFDHDHSVSALHTNQALHKTTIITNERHIWKIKYQMQRVPRLHNPASSLDDNGYIK